MLQGSRCTGQNIGVWVGVGVNLRALWNGMGVGYLQADPVCGQLLLLADNGDPVGKSPLVIIFFEGLRSTKRDGE